MPSTHHAETNGESSWNPRTPAQKLRLFLQLGVGLTAASSLWMLVSAVLHVGTVFYLTHFVPSPTRVGFVASNQDRFVQVFLEAVREVPEVEPEVVVETAPKPEVAEAIADPAAASDSEPEPTPEPEPEPEPAAEPEPEPEPEAVDPGPEPDADASTEAEYADAPQGQGGAEAGGWAGDLVGEGIGGGGGTGPVMRRGTGTALAPARPSAPAPSRAERQATRREEAGRSEENRQRVTRIEEATVAPCAHMRRAPEVPYPRELREQAIAGVVRLQCIITESGHVRGCRHRGGPEELYLVAAPIVEQWRCSPAENADGERIDAPFTFRIPFQLES